MATPTFNAKSPTIKRILREAAELASSPSADYHAGPASDSDLFDWHFTLRGPPSSPYAGGLYHGRIILPPTYPLRPPNFRFMTPNGRFEVNREICLSISGHHEETWMPAWGVRTALVALRSFMETDVKGQLGGMECSAKQRETWAGQSPAWKCSICARSNGDIMKEAEEAAKENGEGSEEKVPEELKLAFKDEMGKREEGDELAEGFVQTGNTGENSATSNPQLYPPARPAQTVPQPTQTIPAPQLSHAQLAQPPLPTAPAVLQPGQRQVIRSNDGVPMWIDRTIAGVFICLAAMILKVMLGI